MNIPLTLYDIGYNGKIDALVDECNAEGFQAGRVISEQKERYRVFTAAGEYDAEITGNMRFSAQSRKDFPAVGDWVLVSLFGNGFAVIHTVLPRYSMIQRSSPENRSEIQIIAANIDYALIVQAADRDFNLNRLERYLAICGDSRIQSIIVITKIDLFEEARRTDLLSHIQNRVTDVPVFMVSNETKQGLDRLRPLIVKGTTWCLLGSSGVGKSTLLNNLFGENRMATGETSRATNKGRHTTSSRELVVLPSGGILIDNPGMREVGITDSSAGPDLTISVLAGSCRFSDCTHTNEKGCAVLEALSRGELDPGLYENFLKMEKEKNSFALTVAERRKKDKDFGKKMKLYQKDKKMNKF